LGDISADLGIMKLQSFFADPPVSDTSTLVLEQQVLALAQENDLVEVVKFE
jgi:hypothetical protein